VIVETGEEGECTVFSARAKVFEFDGSWHERGVGVLKLNLSKAPEEEGENEEEEEGSVENPQKARYILRSDGSQRVVLNSPITKDFTIGKNTQGEKPDGTVLLFRGFLAGQSQSKSLTVKVCITTSLKKLKTN
jgi:Ran-binding protein 3